MTAGSRPCPEPGYQVKRLREAAAHLGSDDAWSVTIPVWLPSPWSDGTTRVRMELPGAMCRPLRGVLLEAAERIEIAGSPLGQPVNYPLQIAGVILSEDLGHNR